jgi:hypothetical protein
MQLEDLETDVLLEFLRCARARGYISAIAAIEAALSSRFNLNKPIREPAFPLSYLSDVERRRVIALARLQSAAARQLLDAFNESLWNLHPDNYVHAWHLARSFHRIPVRAEALRHVAFWIACYFQGADEAAQTISQKTDGKKPTQIIHILEHQFGGLMDRAAQSNGER